MTLPVCRFEVIKGIIMKKTLSAGILLIVCITFYFCFFKNDPVTNSDTSGNVILCFGDSLTFGTGAGRGMSYPDQLSGMLGKLVINSGVPGDTTHTALKRIQEDVLDHRPDIVLITLGGNDLKNGVPVNEAFSNLKRIVEQIQAQGSLVVLAGIDLPFFGKGFGGAYRDLADETGSILIPDIFKGIMGRSKLMSDRIHPNEKGYKVMAEKFYKKISPYLKPD